MRFDTDQEAWTWVRDHPDWVISPFGNAGSTIKLAGKTGTVKLRVAANQQQGILD